MEELRKALLCSSRDDDSAPDGRKGDFVADRGRGDSGVGNCSTNEGLIQGWESAFEAGYRDEAGNYAGGSEIMHLVGHKGKLYAAAGYWMDSRNIVWGGRSADTGWAQILRLDSPKGRFEVDLDLGPYHVRPEVLESVTFTVDGRGEVLAEPVSLLIAGTFNPLPGSGDGLQGHFRQINTRRIDINIFVRDDESGNWERITIIPDASGDLADLPSVRAVRIYRDRVTGIERIFITAGLDGILSGVYDASQPGKICWDARPETREVDIRPLAMTEANDSLFFTSGGTLYRREDGPSPSWKVVHQMPGDIDTMVGGMRGLTAIPNPDGEGDSVLFVWAANALSRGCVYRLDPDGQGGFERHMEVCLADLMSRYLGAVQTAYTLGGYSEFFPVTNPSTNQTVHLVGFESVLIGGDLPTYGLSGARFYAGAVYAIRSPNGQYRVSEVNGRSTAEKPPLVAPRTFEASPFEGEVLYFGGFDANNFPSTNRAWVFSTSVENALGQGTSPSRLEDR